MEPTCDFCNRGSDVDDVCGKLHVEKVEGKPVAAHHKCMQYSAQLVQYKFDHFGGFKIDKVMEEIKRGRKLKCSICNKQKGKKMKQAGRLANGASAGCALRHCKKTFHFYCAHQDPNTITKRMLIRYKEEKQQVVMYRVFCSAEHEREFRSNKSELLLPFNTGNASSSDDSETENEKSSDDDDTVSCVSQEKNNNAESSPSIPRISSVKDENNISILSQPSPVPTSSKRSKILKGKTKQSSSSRPCPKSKKNKLSSLDDDKCSNTSSLELQTLFDLSQGSNGNDDVDKDIPKQNGSTEPGTPITVKVVAEINHPAMGTSPSSSQEPCPKTKSKMPKMIESSEDDDEIKPAPIEVPRSARKCAMNSPYNKASTSSIPRKELDRGKQHSSSKHSKKRRHSSSDSDDFVNEKRMSKQKSKIKKQKKRVIDSDSDEEMDSQEGTTKSKTVHVSHEVVNIKPKSVPDRESSPVIVIEDNSQETQNGVAEESEDVPDINVGEAYTQETQDINMKEDNSEEMSNGMDERSKETHKEGKVDSSLGNSQCQNVSIKLQRIDSNSSVENSSPCTAMHEKRQSKARRSLEMKQSELFCPEDTPTKSLVCSSVRKESDSSLDHSKMQNDSINTSTDGEREPTNLPICGLILTQDLECKDALRSDLLKLAAKELDIEEQKIAFWLDTFKLECLQKEIMPHLMNDIGQILCNEDIDNGKIAKLLTNADRLHRQLPNYDYVLTLYKSMSQSLVQTMQENVFKTLKQNLVSASKKYGYTLGKLLTVHDMNALILTVDDKLDPKGLIREKMLPDSSDDLYVCSADMQFHGSKKSVSKNQTDQEATKILNFIKNEFQGEFTLKVNPVDPVLVSDEETCVTQMIPLLEKSDIKNKSCSNHVLCVQPVDTHIVNYSLYCKKLLGQFALNVEQNDKCIMVVSVDKSVTCVDDLISGIIVEEQNLFFLTAHDPQESPVSSVVITDFQYIGKRSLTGKTVNTSSIHIGTPRQQKQTRLSKEVIRSSPRKHQSSQ